MTQQFSTEIKYDRTTKDFAAYVAGEVIGFAGNYHEAENLITAHVAELVALEANISRLEARMHVA